MADQDLKNKYQPVADFMSHNGFQIAHFHSENNKAVLSASAPTEYLKNRAWDEIRRSIPISPTCNTISLWDRERCTS